MTNRQRVLGTLHHRQPDKVPYHIKFTKDAYAKMADFYGDPNFESKLGNCFTVLPGRPKHTWKEIKPGFILDDWGTIWDCRESKDIGNITNYPVNADNVNDFPFPDPDDPVRYQGFQELIDANEDRFVVANFSLSLWERAYVLAGMENMMIAMMADEKFTNAFFDRILEWNLRVIEQFCSFDIDAVLLGDDYGQQTGLLLGAKLWRKYLKPRIKQMSEAVKSKGHYVFIHSCGNIVELFDNLIEMGLDVYNPFQPEVMDVFEVKKQYGDRLCFYGGISTQKTLPFGTVQEVKDEVSRLIEKIGKNGGYFAAPAHDTPSDVKTENVAAMIEVLQNQ